MIQSRSIITGPTFISLGLMGAFFACWGTTLPALRSFLQIDIEKAAMLTAYGQASHSVTCLLGGILSDLFRRDKVLMAGCLVLGSGVILLGSSNSFIQRFPGALDGDGAGFILSSSNALLVSLSGSERRHEHHGVFRVGSFISPLVMGKLLGYRASGPTATTAWSFFLPYRRFSS
jgi:MFS family permease